MKALPSLPDSPAVKFALMPARIKWWREQGNEPLAQQLEAEYVAAGGVIAPEAQQRSGADA